MDSFNWLMAELLNEQRERLFATQRPPIVLSGAPERAGMRRTLATIFVRLGLRLDPAAGEGLGTVTAPLIPPKMRRAA